MSLNANTIVGNSTGSEGEPEMISCTAAGFSMLAAANVQAQQNLLAEGVQYLKSPDGHYWSVSISNLGVVTYTDVGTSIP